jgi:hypothetical protein
MLLRGCRRVLCAVLALCSLAIASTTSAQQVAPNDWVSELPTPAAVKQAMHGSDPADTVAQQDAALEVFRHYVIVRSGRTNLSAPSNFPAADARWADYQSAQSVPRVGNHQVAGPTAAAWPYVRRTDFQIAVLSKFVSAGSLAEFQRSPWFQRTKAEERPPLSPADVARAQQQQAAFDARMNAAVADFHLPTPGARIPDASPQVKASVDLDLKAAHDAHAETSVLGIELGQPLGLADCPDSTPTLSDLADGTAGGTAQPVACRLPPGGWASMIDRATIMGDALPFPGTEDVIVKLPTAKCPDWVSCRLVVTLKNNYVLMVALLTRSGASFDEVEQRLTAKYRKNPEPGSPSKCQLVTQPRLFQPGTGARITTDTAPSKYWNFPGLRAFYVPYGSTRNCDQGAIIVQLDAYLRFRKEVQTAVESRQLKF